MLLKLGGEELLIELMAAVMPKQDNPDFFSVTTGRM